MAFHLARISLGWRLALVAAAVVIAALCVAPFYLFPTSDLPATAGPHCVGTRQFDLAVGDPQSSPRKLQVRVWYPARQDPGAKPRNYFNEWEAHHLAPSIADNLDFPRFMLAGLARVRTHSFEDAPPSGEVAAFPVVLFSHGYWSYSAQNWALMELLASHGYVVFSLAHPGDAATIRFDDGTIVRTTPYDSTSEGTGPAEKAFWGGLTHDERVSALPAYAREIDGQRIMKSFRTWRADSLSLLQTLRRGEVPAALADVLAEADLHRLALAGMSFGGTIATSVCQAELDCKAVVNLDGEEFGFDLFDTDVRFPLLMLTSDWTKYPIVGNQPRDPAFHVNDYFYEPFAQAGLRPNVHRVRIVGIRHLGFTDLPLWVRWPASRAHFGDVDGEVAVRQINQLSLAFLDEQVKGEAGRFPPAGFAKDPRIVFRDASAVRRWWLAKTKAAASH